MANQILEQMLQENLSEKLKNTLDKFLMVHGSTIKSMEELLEFTPYGSKPDETITFLKTLKSKFEKNPAVLNQLSTTLKKLNKISPRGTGNYAALLLFGLGDQTIDIDSSIKYSDSVLYQVMRSKFDKASFFVTESAYNRFIKNSSYLGYPNGEKDDGRKRTAQWVFPSTIAEKMIKDFFGKPGNKDKDSKQAYADALGLDIKNIKKEKGFYHIQLNGKAIRETAEATKATMYLPHGQTPGANDYFIPGGATSGGLPEMIFNTVPREHPYLIDEKRYAF